MSLLMIAALALGGPVDPETTPAPVETAPSVDTARKGVPGTTANPIRVRITRTTVTKAEDTVQREWAKLERALLDLQNSLYGETKRGSRAAGLEPGKPLRVRVDRDLHVYLEVLESTAEWRSVRLRVEDQDGQPVDGIERATIQTPGEAEQELVFAGGHELVIENLESAPEKAVRLYVGDGDVILILLEE